MGRNTLLGHCSSSGEFGVPSLFMGSPGGKEEGWTSVDVLWILFVTPWLSSGVVNYFFAKKESSLQTGLVLISKSWGATP